MVISVNVCYQLSKIRSGIIIDSRAIMGKDHGLFDGDLGACLNLHSLAVSAMHRISGHVLLHSSLHIVLV